jgi:ATP-dependent RNA helicase DOB1
MEPSKTRHHQVHITTQGGKFADICKINDRIFEGSIIRCMRRLDELLQQVASAARVLGSLELEEKVNRGIKMIRRDIVFAASLYL